MNPEQSQQQSMPEYLEYWDNFYELNKSLSEEYDDFEKAVAFTKRRFLALDRIVAESFQIVGRDFVTETKHWYYRTGSLNPMEGGELQLTRAAIIMERFCDDSEAKGFGYSTFNDRLMAAVMYHEAGLVCDDQLMRNQLYLAARSNYEKLMLSSGLKPTTVEHQQAVQYIADLDFQVLHEQSQSGEIDPTQIREVFEDLQIEYVDSFLRYLKESDDLITLLKGRLQDPDVEERDKIKIRKKIGGLQSNISGSAFEWFTSLAFRHEIYISGGTGEATIRTSFPREQHPRFWTRSEMKHRKKQKSEQQTRKTRAKKGPSHSFDKLIVTHDDVESREWVQLKTGRSSSQSYLPKISHRRANLQHDRSNLPTFKIKTVEIGRYDDFVALLAVSADAMKQQYQHQKISHDDQKLVEFSLSLLHPQPA